jgi:hypothetical protein
MKLLVILSVGFEVTDQIRFSAFVRCWRINGSTIQLCIYFKKSYDSVRRDVLYNILIESGVPLKLVRLNKVCLTFWRLNVF